MHRVLRVAPLPLPCLDTKKKNQQKKKTKQDVTRLVYNMQINVVAITALICF